MAVTIKNPITVVKGGGGVSIPTTWAELKAMTATDLKKIYPLGSFIDLPCQYAYTSSDTYDFQWEVVSYKPCKIENDNTDYPCVTLLLRTTIPDGYLTDAREQMLADSSTEPNALSGTYYYGIATSSGNPASTDITALNLSVGDAIPYGTYPRIYKTSINTNDMNNIQHLWRYGYNNYPLSNIRQWLNADAASGWFTPSHIGDSAPNFQSHQGFLYKLPSDFTSVLSATAVVSVLNSTTDGGATVTTYDKMFIPSLLEMNFDTQIVEGTVFEGIKYGAQRGKPHPQETMPTASGTMFSANGMRLRTVISSSVDQLYQIDPSGALSSSGLSAYSSSPRVCPACRIILAGA